MTVRHNAEAHRYEMETDHGVAIAVYLEAATASIRSTESGIQREIALIQEFRTRLIADVVTGKLDARAIAATLPEAPDNEPIENAGKEDDFDGDDAEPENEDVAA